MKLHILAILAIAAGVVALPLMISAQPGSQQFTFYGEEPWGGSYLGVDTRDITVDRLEALHLKEEQGVEITMVDQDAPAGKAGLKEHDVILTVNDQKVESVEQLRRLIREVPSGRVVTVGISRDGQPMSVKAQLAERKSMPHMDGSFNLAIPAVNIPAIHVPPMNMPEMDLPMTVVVIHSLARSGLMVENLTPQLGDFFGVKSGNGVMVRSVEKGSRAEQAGFHAGDVIVKVNGTAVNDSSDFTRLLRARKENKAAITVMRDRKEQNLTLTLPEPKRSGSLNREKECEAEGSQPCIEMFKQELLESAPEIETAETKRIQPDIEILKKELREENLNREELKEEMEEMQQDLRRDQQDLQQEMKWTKDADI